MTLLEIFDPKASPRSIGIDLGTTNSLVARVRDGKPAVITDCDDNGIVPSAVHYDARGGVIVGKDALLRASAYPSETIVSVKRFMGRGADDPETKRSVRTTSPRPRHRRRRRASASRCTAR